MMLNVVRCHCSWWWGLIVNLKSNWETSVSSELANSKHSLSQWLQRPTALRMDAHGQFGMPWCIELWPRCPMATNVPPQALAETTSPEGNEVQRFLVFLVELSWAKLPHIHDHPWVSGQPTDAAGKSWTWPRQSVSSSTNDLDWLTTASC